MIIDGMKCFYCGGYYRTKIKGISTMIHRVVWEKHHGKIPEKCVIRHIDGNLLNNDIKNLEMTTKADSQKYSRGYKKDESGDWAFKRCFDCEELLPFKSFYKSSRNERMSRCKKCESEYHKKKYKKKKGEVKGISVQANPSTM